MAGFLAQLQVKFNSGDFSGAGYENRTGTVVIPHEDNKGFDVHVNPAWDLWVTSTVVFQVTLPELFPKERPIAKCIQCEESIRTDPRLLMVVEEPPPEPPTPDNDKQVDDEDEDDGAYVSSSDEEGAAQVERPKLYKSRIDKDGKVHCHLFDSQYMGWLEFYNIEVVVHSLRLLFKKSDPELAPSPQRYVRIDPLPLTVRSAEYEEQGPRSAMEDRVVLEDVRFIPDPELPHYPFHIAPWRKDNLNALLDVEDRICEDDCESDCKVGGRDADSEVDSKTDYVMPDELLNRTIPGRKISFHAVLDGHGGWRAAENVSRLVGEIFYEELALKDISIERALYNAISRTEEKLAEMAKRERERKGYVINTSGTTVCAVAVDLDQGIAYCANVGDSRAVLCRNGTALPLSEDHKANRPEEVARVVHTGGFVSYGRVLGMLAVSRALGDPEMKSPNHLVVSVPDITKLELAAKDEFIVIACDGIYDVMSNQEVIDFVRKGIAVRGREQLKQVCMDLVYHALKDLHTQDNVSVIIVDLAPRLVVPPDVVPMIPLHEDDGMELNNLGENMSGMSLEHLAESVAGHLASLDASTTVSSASSSSAGASSAAVESGSQTFISPTVHAAALASRLRKHNSSTQ